MSSSRKAAAGIKGIPGWVLQHPVMQYLSRISYGICVFHVFVFWLLPPFTNGLDRCLRGTSAAVCFLASVALASVSWHFFEYPINRSRQRITAAFIRQPVAAPASN